MLSYYESHPCPQAGWRFCTMQAQEMKVYLISFVFYD
jgi:hypothetical protein